MKPNTFVFAGYHKTGSGVLCRTVKKYNNRTNSKHITSNHFNYISNNTIRNTKCVVIVRHPYEIIMSGSRYHMKTEEPWCCKQIYQDDRTYQDILQSLDPSERILFEMRNCAFRTIMDIYNDMKNRNYNDNVLFIKLEELQNDFNGTITKLYNHCNSAININLFTNLFNNTSIQLDYHKTTNDFAHTYPKHFEQVHYDEINKLFPEDLLQVMGYK